MRIKPTVLAQVMVKSSMKDLLHITKSGRTTLMKRLSMSNWRSLTNSTGPRSRSPNILWARCSLSCLRMRLLKSTMSSHQLLRRSCMQNSTRNTSHRILINLPPASPAAVLAAQRRCIMLLPFLEPQDGSRSMWSSRTLHRCYWWRISTKRRSNLITWYINALLSKNKKWFGMKRPKRCVKLKF